MRASLALIMTLVLAILPAAEPAQGWYEHREMLYFNIDCTLRFHGENQVVADAIWKEWKEIDGIFNDYKDDSEISRINAVSDLSYECSPLLTKAFAEAILELLDADPLERAQQALAARDWVGRHRGYDVIAQQVCAQLHAVVRTHVSACRPSVAGPSGEPS